MILEAMQFTLGELPFKYLGVPLSSKKLTVQQCMPLIEKITTRINCWTTKLLSYSGRLQLLKSVIFKMQTYWAQAFLLPKKILKLIILACRTFLWTGRGEPSRRVLIAWDTVCMPFSAGGLNVLDIHIWNKATLCKLLWDVSAKKDSLWIQWIHSYYIKGQDSMSMDTPKQACWLVSKIFDIRYWFLEKYTSADLHRYYRNGKFSIKKLYIAMRPQFQKSLWKKVLTGSKAIPKHRFILWLAIHRKLATIDRLERQGVTVAKECVLCTTKEEESMEHI